MNIIDERDVRTIHRKIRKKEYDEIITLSAGDNGMTVRLLDEGAVVTAGGYIDFYIVKGSLQRYLDALPDDYEGSINLGHMDFATFPFVLGRWSKKDLHLVDIGDGRKALDVDLRLDNDSFIVKELRRMPYDLGVSAEFHYQWDEALTEEYGFLIIDELFITDFAIVGEAGNVNSSGIKLKGGVKDVNLKELAEKLEAEKAKDYDDILKVLSAQIEESAEQTEDTAKDEATEEAKKTDEADAEDSAEGAEETAGEDEEAAPEEEQTDGLNAVMEAFEALKADNEALKAELNEVKAKLAVKEQKEKDFFEKFPQMVASISGDKKKETVKVDSPATGTTNGYGKL